VDTTHVPCNSTSSGGALPLETVIVSDIVVHSQNSLRQRWQLATCHLIQLQLLVSHTSISYGYLIRISHISYGYLISHTDISYRIRISHISYGYLISHTDISYLIRISHISYGYAKPSCYQGFALFGVVRPMRWEAYVFYGSGGTETRGDPRKRTGVSPLDWANHFPHFRHFSPMGWAADWAVVCVQPVRNCLSMQVR
jgi:hypothetical protein